jgi:hypothetical protein
LALAGVLVVVCLEADLAGETFATFLVFVCFDTGFEADALGELTFPAVALLFGDVDFPALDFFADDCAFLFASFLAGGLGVAEFLVVDALAFEDTILLSVVFAFDVAGLLEVDLTFEATPNLGLDVATVFPAGLAVFLVPVIPVDFAFGDIALPPATFVLDLVLLALVRGFALVTPLFFLDVVAVD